MNDRFLQSREAVAHSRAAIKNGQTDEARKWAEHAADLAPQSEDPWLILASLADNPQESVLYVRKALQLNPESVRAKKGMEWALRRVRETSQGNTSPIKTPQPKVAPEAQTGKSAPSARTKNPQQRSRFLPILLISMGCAVFAFAAWSAVNSPVLASIINVAAAPQAQSSRGPLFAQVNIAKPTYTAASPGLAAEVLIPTTTETTVPTGTAVQESLPDVVMIPPSLSPPIEAQVLPTDTAVVEDPATSTAEATTEPGNIYAEIIPDTPTSEYVAPTSLPSLPAVAVGGGEHWIDVNLSEQRVYAYEGDAVVNSFLVSTGTWQTPTVTGKYHIWIKLLSTTMTGPGYYLPNVPYTMYFYKGYGLHGTYWHNNFGTPMSHGCVNLRTSDAEWLYNFSSVGTLVNVHY